MDSFLDDSLEEVSLDLSFLEPLQNLVPNEVIHAIESNTSNSHVRKKKSRPNLPKAAVSILQHWFYQHWGHPYLTRKDLVTLTEQINHELGSEANVSRAKILNWFVNTRKRTWGPEMRKRGMHQVPPAPKTNPVPDRESKKHIRKGNWTKEEVAYCSRLVAAFHAGELPMLERGESLRLFLARELNCSPMRVSKKFAGTLALGKNHYIASSTLDPCNLEITRTELEALKANFLEVSSVQPATASEENIDEWFSASFEA